VLQVHIASSYEREFATIEEVQAFLREESDDWSRIFIDYNGNVYVSARQFCREAFLVQVNSQLGGPHPMYPIKLAPEGSFVILTEKPEED